MFIFILWLYHTRWNGYGKSASLVLVPLSHLSHNILTCELFGSFVYIWNQLCNGSERHLDYSITKVLDYSTTKFSELYKFDRLIECPYCAYRLMNLGSSAQGFQSEISFLSLSLHQIFNKVHPNYLNG